MFYVDTVSACTLIPLNIFKQCFSDDKLKNLMVNCESTGHVYDDNMIDEVMSICSVKSQMVKYLELRFTAAFNKENEKPIKQFKVNINVKNNCVPIFCKACNVPYALLDSVKKELLSLENKVNGHLQLFVSLKRITVCGSKSNIEQKCVSISVSFAKTEDLFQKFHESNDFCPINVSNAYLQLEVNETASDIFQSVIDKILEGIKNCGAYQDDRLIGVLSRLNDYNVNINIQKSEFFVKSLEILAYVLSADGLSPCKSKVGKLINTKILQNIAQLKSYLGLFNYYCTNSSKWLPISSYGVVAVLSQLHNVTGKQVAFESATLNNSQKNYSQLHREAFSII
ncbi:hypothetical protein PR048_005443 [Dryococelus australis]|uniref:Reverse transcriptase RNase H-like domain-containing protein n=1 Tax=Dryococelus australis TaxID=614101 RepID=A0ABQ9I861_9NEOP|nr:hypothetical protein PR048_005443 [Dryococelus australis]